MDEEIHEVPGRCHICREPALIALCPECGHWFCEACRGRWFWRGWEFVKEKFLVGARPGCCGPEGSHAAVQVQP